MSGKHLLVFLCIPVNSNKGVGNVQDFAKSLLDVADNLERALEIVRKSESSAGAGAKAKQLKSLLEGVEMTEKQLMKVRFQDARHQFIHNCMGHSCIWFP